MPWLTVLHLGCTDLGFLKEYSGFVVVLVTKSCKDERYKPFKKGNVPCLPSLTGFSSKLVFNLAEYPTLL